MESVKYTIHSKSEAEKSLETLKLNKQEKVSETHSILQVWIVSGGWNLQSKHEHVL